MKRLILAAGLLAVAVPACADPILLKPIIDLRVRYEDDHQQGLAADSDARTARLRAGVAASDGPWSALVEAQGDLGRLRGLQQQPAQRERSVEEQLHRFFGAGSGRKIRYGALMVAALAEHELPGPLAGLLHDVRAALG